MTLPRLSALAKYWKDFPPLNESVAAIAFGFGVLKKAAPAEGSPEHQQEMAELIGNAQPKHRPRPA